MIGDIDYSKVTPYRPKLSVCNPNKSSLAILKEAYEITQDLKLGNINSLSFRLPYERDLRHNLNPNANIDLILPRRLIKFQKNNVTEYYVISKISDVMTDNEDYKEVQCDSLGIQLSWRNITGYNQISKSATEILTDLLSGTGWSIGTVDASFNLIRRSPSIDNDTVLGSLFKIAEVFNALLVFNTNTNTISLTVLNQLAPYEGLKVSYGKLLQAANKTDDMTEFCTRLIVKGRDIGINSVTATGANYIENYGAYLYPYQEDINGVVIKSSYFMSDSLAHALTVYQILVTNSVGTLTGFLNTKSGLQATKTSQNNVLFTYQTDLKIINDQLVVANASGTSNTTILANKTAKEAQITTQTATIATTQASINAVDVNIAALVTSLSIAVNFTTDQINEWKYYINERTFSNDLITDPTELLNAAKVEFDKLREPKVTVDISVVDFLECISEQASWSKIFIGAQISVYVEKLGIDIRATITEMNQNYESSSISIKIANINEIISDERRMLNKLYSSFSSANTVTSEKYGWRNAVAGINTVNIQLSNPYDSSLQPIIGGYNESIEISERGIIMTSPTDVSKMLILNHAVLAISSDGGLNWQNSISPSGINASSIKTGSILGINLSIGSGSAIFNANASGISLGAATWETSPFRVDMAGNLVSSSATITGQINATSGSFSGSISSSATITGGTIQTAPSGGRLVLSGGSLQSLNGATLQGVSINSMLSGLGGYLSFHENGSQIGTIEVNSDKISINSSRNININATGTIALNSSSILLGGSLSANDISITSGTLGGSPIATQAWVNANFVHL